MQKRIITLLMIIAGASLEFLFSQWLGKWLSKAITVG